MSNLLDHISKTQELISIAGPSGTGKTTLALQLVDKILTNDDKFSGSCVWIEASEQFPKKRLGSLHKKDSERLQYLLHHIYAVPSNSTFNNYLEQAEYMEQFSKKLMPEDLKVIVIDNISHHLRFYLSNLSDIGAKSKVMNTFYSSQLYPLAMRCLRESFTLILLHEASYDPHTNKNRPFFWKLYNRLELCDLYLEKRFNDNQKQLSISTDNEKLTFYYTIEDCGLEFVEFHANQKVQLVD